MRLITKETKMLARGENPLSNERTKRAGGILIESAEGLRFAYTSVPLPKSIGNTATSAILEVSPDPGLLELPEQPTKEQLELF